jgi:formamidopyrimidine-DNA glycosylase
MPELPEVETVKNFLNLHLLKRTILWAKIENKKLRYEIPPQICKILINSRITKIIRRGKYLIFLLNNKFAILCHLGMTGCFRVSTKSIKRKHDHLLIGTKKKQIIFNDIRKFGFIRLYKASEIFTCPHLKKIGPEPLSENFNISYLEKNKSKKVSVKSFLMNQNNVAGLGNIYCSEILFDSGIHPEKNFVKLKPEEYKKILKSTKKILNQAIEKGGTTIKDYNISDEKIGYFKNKLKVYDRNGMACYRCKKNINIKKIFQNGRSTFYCVKCQK